MKEEEEEEERDESDAAPDRCVDADSSPPCEVWRRCASSRPSVRLERSSNSIRLNSAVEKVPPRRVR